MRVGTEPSAGPRDRGCCTARGDPRWETSRIREQDIQACLVMDIGPYLDPVA